MFDDVDAENHLIYLASPYTHKKRAIEIKRFKIVEAVTAASLRRGLFVYSPIVHCHALAERYNLPTDAKFWEKYNHAVLARCSHMIVVTMEGWTESKGVKAEIDFAIQHNIPISYVIGEPYAKA